MPDLAHLGSTPIGAASGPSGHGDENPHRSAGFGVVYTTLTPPPVTGSQNKPTLTPIPFNLSGSTICDPHMCSVIHAPALPYQDFPKFDGTNPHLWVKKCETYFDVYHVDPHLWVKLATMNLAGSAELWFQTLQTPIEKLSWSTFILAACTRFDRDEHNLLLRQFFHIHQQTSTVSGYVEHFSDPTIAPSVSTNHFVDGLRRDIRAIVMVHRPQDLDTASSLAFLQEEATQDLSKKSEMGYYSKKHSADSAKTSTSSLPSPPRTADEKKSLDPPKGPMMISCLH